MEDKKESSRIGFVNTPADGSWYGNLTWDDNKYLLRNIRAVRDGVRQGDVTRETGKTYMNKAGRECKEYEVIGCIRFTKDSGVVVIGDKVNEHFTVLLKENSKGAYLMLSFEEPNPYAKFLDNSMPLPEATHVISDPVTPLDVDDEIPY